MSKKRKTCYEIKPVQVDKDPDDDLPIKHGELSNTLPLYHNTFLAAKTNSGKSTVLHHILLNTLDKRSTVFLFCSTYELDAVWMKTIEELRDRKIKVLCFDGMIENGVNRLEIVLKELAASIAGEQEEDGVPSGGMLVLDNLKPNGERKPRPKDRVPKHVIVLDDLNTEELRHRTITNLVKKSRHYQAKVYISSQHLLHASPQTFTNLQACYLWGGFSRHYIEEAWSRLNLGIDKKQFWLLYCELTREKYSFMNVNMRDNAVRQNLYPEPINLKQLFAPDHEEETE